MKSFPFDPPTGWAPSAYVNETAPPVRDTPDAWIAEQSGGGIYLAGPDEDEGLIKRQFVASAEVTKFSAYFALGYIEIAIAADGSWTSAEPVPEGASNFTVPGDLDFHSMSIDDIAQNWAATTGDTGEETLTIECWHWIDNLRFILGRQPQQPFTFIPVQTVGGRVSEEAGR